MRRAVWDERFSSLESSTYFDGNDSHREDVVRHMMGDAAWEQEMLDREQGHIAYNVHRLECLPRKWRSEHGSGEYEIGTGLYLHGTIGCGKTYQAAGIAAKLIMSDEDARWVSTADWLFELRASYSTGGTPDIRLEHCTLFIDDIGMEKPSDWAKESIYRLVNRAYEAGVPTVVTSNLTFQELADRIGPRTVDRLVEMCRPIKMQGESRRLNRHNVDTSTVVAPSSPASC